MESFSSSVVTRKLCLAEGDVGLASIAGTENGCSWNYPKTGPFCYSKGNSLKNLYYHNSVPSPRSVVSGFSRRFHDSRFDGSHLHQPHFLDSCFLCKKPLGGNNDIFMYRGDTPFCSEECREEQIEIDEAKEKKHSLSSMKALRRKEQRNSSSSSPPTKSQDYPFSTGTVAAA